MNNVTVMSEISCNTKVFYKTKKKLYLIVKRFFDIIVSLVGIVFLIPIAIVIKICTVISCDFDSIIFSQSRIGKNGKKFRLYKFRSMVPNANLELKKILKADKELAREYRINKKLSNDPRVTKIGKFIRKTSIDELPQVINILKGDMSLIGNRPYLPREKSDMGKSYGKIVKTKPGLTGYWQVSGRSNTSFEKRLELETFYSSRACFSLDVKIFFRTFGVVLFGKDAR